MSPIHSVDTLRCFLAVVRALNFRNAARAVALTPTALGQRIHQLEDQVGTALFLRTTRSVSLTEAGLALIPPAERCIAAADECVRVATATGEIPPMELTLGTRQELGMSWVLPQRKAITRMRPWLRIHLYFGAGRDLLYRTRTNEIDLAITSTASNDTRLCSLELHRELYVLVAAEKLLARAPLARPADLGRHALLDISSDLPLFRYWRDARGASADIQFEQKTFLGCIAAIRHEVLEGTGVAVLPEYFVRDELAAGALKRVLPEIEPLSDHFHLFFRATDPRCALFASLAEDLREAQLH
jgi:LysR family glycine cleavage system transcriptional activator